MKADFSRVTFHPEQHYRRVLGQQGRVVIDADRNEQTSIDIAVAEQTNYDLVGQSGVPEISFSSGSNGGFEIGISPTPNDLTIALGRIYVDGILVQNDTATTLSTQPFLPMTIPAFETAGITGDGLYCVYLDVWERLVTQVDDADIVEIALGGPDTSLRSQIAWQVKLGPIAASPGSNPSCAQVAAPWPASSSGQLAAQGGAPATDSLPCVIPPQSGFRSLENQLYRVEIHTPGPAGQATFKWSRENGSVIAGILSQVPGSSATPTYNVQTVGRDDSLGFAVGDWVELIDDSSEFQSGAGELLMVTAVDGVAMTISVNAAPTSSIDITQHPKLRRWDQTENATATGVLVVAGSWIDLENGLQVQFSDGPFNVGDYWMIPARAASTAQSVGVIDWPTDPATNAALFRSPLGIRHHYTKLAIVSYTGGTFSAPSGAAAVTDCRAFFPPLTSIPSPALAMHVQAVSLVQSGSPLLNDAQITASELSEGILVTCDQAVDPVSIEPDTCEIALLLPSSAVAGLGTQAVTLDCGLNVTGAVIGVAPSAAAATPLQNIFTTFPGVASLLGRLRLRGGFIWAAGNPSIYLDGTSFGAPRAGGGTDIVLPSGNGVRAGDFELWFSLAAPPPPPLAVQSLSFNVAATGIAAGGTVTGTIIMNQSVPLALAQGAVVVLTQTEQDISNLGVEGAEVDQFNESRIEEPIAAQQIDTGPGVGVGTKIDTGVGTTDTTNFANPPSSVTVPAGATQVEFTFPTTAPTPVRLGLRESVTITAAYGNTAGQSASFVVFTAIL